MELRDNWSVSGNDFEEFKRQVHDVDSKTGVIDVKSASNIMLLSLKTKKDKQYEFYVLDDDNIEAFNAGNDVAITNAVLEAPLFEEMAKTTGLLLIYDNVKYILSKDAIFSLGERANINGTHLQRKSFIRDLYLAEGLFPPDEKIRIKMVYKKEVHKRGGKVYALRKVFSCMGTKFIHEPLSTVADIAEEVLTSHPFGKAVCRNWFINHKFCSIQLEFPEYDAGLPDNIIPGIRIITSDTGHSSLRVMSTFRVDGSEEVVFDEESWTHSSEYKNIKEEVYDYINTVFPTEFATIPVNLLEKTKSKKGRANLVLNWYSSELHLVAAIGKSRTKSLLEELAEDSKRISEYDAIMRLITSQKMLDDLPVNAQMKLAKAFGRAPFIKGKDVVKAWED